MDHISILGMSSVSALGSISAVVRENYSAGQALFSKTTTPSGPVAVARLSQQLEQEVEQLAQQNPNYKRLDRTALLAILAARGSMDGMQIKGKWGVNIGSSRGATGLFEKYHQDFINRGEAHTLSSPTTTLGNVSTWVAQDLQLPAMSLGHSVTCASAMHAVLNGIAWLGSGMVQAMLVGGTEAPLTAFTIAQMQALNLYSKNTDGFACRALDLDKTANTMVLGEAAATAVLVLGDHPQAQGRICGFGWGTETLDHHTSLSKQADCFQDSMKMALTAAGLEIVDAVVMHAPGTILGDKAEYRALQEVFGSNLPYLVSNKHLIGHTLGTSGMLSLELAMLMLQQQDCPVNPFLEQAIEKPQQFKTVMINAVGFGGNAVSLIVCK